MIKSDFGIVTIKGDVPLIMAEFSSLVYSLIKQNIFTKETIQELVNDGMKEKGEIEEEVLKKYKDGMSTQKLQELIGGLVKTRRSGITKECKDLEETQIKTIFDNNDFKITEISIDTKGKTEDEIKREIMKAFNKTFDENYLGSE